MLSDDEANYADFEDPERFVDPTTRELPESRPVARKTAESITFNGDEDGWHMLLDTGDQLFDVNIHGIAPELVEAVDRTIGRWWGEAELARRMAPRLTEEDLDAYELGDPKRIALERELRGEK